MSKVIRKDVFNIGNDSRLPTGYVVLKKKTLHSNNDYLNQLIVSDDVEVFSPYSIGSIVNSELYDNVDDGDIGLVTGRGNLRVVLSKRANHNTLLVTERCDNACVFCSQPPKAHNDDWLLTQAALAICAFKTDDVIGISGGEPLLYGSRFLFFLDTLIEYSPNVKLHVLSNGRAFSSLSFAEEIKKRSDKIAITFGIPLYSSISEIHDVLVGSEGAFSETIKGLINAGNIGISLELRFIPVKGNVKNIESVISLIARCLSNVVQVSIMNVEPAGWAKKNWQSLYIKPEQYIDELLSAIQVANRAKLPVKLFNYPLCHLPTTLRDYAVKSISDWKNYFPDDCTGCKLKDNCGGYFSSSKGLFHQNARRVL